MPGLGRARERLRRPPPWVYLQFAVGGNTSIDYKSSGSNSSYRSAKHTYGTGSNKNNVNPSGSYTKFDSHGEIYSYTQFDALGREQIRIDF